MSAEGALSPALLKVRGGGFVGTLQGRHRSSVKSCPVFAGSGCSPSSPHPPPVLGEACGYHCIWVLQQISRIPRNSEKAGLGGSKPRTVHFSFVQESAAPVPRCRCSSTRVHLETPFQGYAGAEQFSQLRSVISQFSLHQDDVFFLQLCFIKVGEPYYLRARCKDKLTALYALCLSSWDSGHPGFVVIPLTFFFF